jgi:hypothetical protein|tara:strand:- start:1242 stop:1568 length:327 start_codon:yes stop_codon:yes gene_type:complete
MLLRDLYTDTIEEGVATIFGKKGNSTVRKYRCTSGTRKGRIVAKAATCNAPKNMKASNTLKKTRRTKGSVITTKASRTKRTNPASQRLKRMNTGRRTISKTKRRGSRI